MRVRSGRGDVTDHGHFQTRDPCYRAAHRTPGGKANRQALPAMQPGLARGCAGADAADHRYAWPPAWRQATWRLRPAPQRRRRARRPPLPPSAAGRYERPPAAAPRSTAPRWPQCASNRAGQPPGRRQAWPPRSPPARCPRRARCDAGQRIPARATAAAPALVMAASSFAGRATAWRPAPVRRNGIASIYL